MSDAVLTFKLPEEQSEFNAACDGMKNLLAIHRLDQRCRGFLKYRTEEMKDVDQVLEDVRSFINNNIDLERIE